jgi:hypothetical protein
MQMVGGKTKGASTHESSAPTYSLSLPMLMITDKLVRAKPDKIIIEMANRAFSFEAFLYCCMILFPCWRFTLSGYSAKKDDGPQTRGDHRQ